MKKLLTLRKRKLMMTLSLLLALFAGGVNSAWAETLTANFNSGLPEGWSIVGSITNDDTRNRSGKGLWTDEKSTTDNYVITEAVEGTFEFYARAYNKSYASTVVIYEYTGSGLGNQLYTTGSMYTSSTPSWSKYSFTISSGTQLAIVLNYAAIDDVTYTQMEAVEGPALTIKDGSTKIASPYSYDFGLATAGTTHKFTLSNPGTAAVEGLSVSETGSRSFDATLSETSIAAGGKATLTVTMPEETASSEITISSTTEGIGDFVINVSGTVKDPNKMFVDFADNVLPEDWESAASSTYYSWNFESGYAAYSGSSSSYSGTLKSPKLTFTAGEKFFFNTSRYGSSTWYSPSISIQTSTDGNTWTTVQTYTDDEYGVWKTRSVEIASADVKYIRFSGWYINIDNIYGGELQKGAKFAITPSETAKDFGFVEKDALVSNTFNVTNSGTSDLVITFTESGDFSVAQTVAFTKPSSWSGSKLYIYAWNSEGALTAAWPGDEVTNAAQNGFGEWVYTAAIPDGATAIIFNDGNNQTSDISTNGFKKFVGLYLDGSTVKQWKNEDVFTVPAASNASFSIKMNTATAGEKTGSVALAFDALNATSHTIQATGYVADPEVILVDFADNTIPEGWENSGFNIANNEITTTYYTRTLTSPAITVAEGQKLVIYAKGGSTYSAMLTVKASTDNGSTWTTAKEFTTELRNNTTDYVVLVVDNIEAGNYKLQFEGYYVTISDINGYTYNLNAPLLEVTPDEDFDAGVVTANKTKTYTVKNVGTGTLTVNIASNNEQFTVNPTQLEVTDEAKEFTVTFNVEEGVYGKFNANITVTPTYDETAVVTIGASAKVKDPNVWEEDFEEGTLPTGWVANNWTIGKFSDYENETNMALAPSSSTAGTLITPCLTAKENDVLTWDAYLNWYDEALIVEYSNDEQVTWTQIYNYKTQEDADAPRTSQRYYHKEMSFTAPAEGNYYLRFTSTYQNGVDNFNGFKLNLKEHDAQITSTNIPATGTQYVEYTATVTVKELAGKEDEVVTAELWIGTEKVTEVSEVKLAANDKKVIELIFTPDKAISGNAYIKVYNDDIDLTSETKAVEISAALVLDEEEVELGSFETGEQPVVVKYTAKSGWNTICVPFVLTSDILNQIFGEGWKAYEFKGYSDNKLNFNTTTTFYAGYPYIIYVETAATHEDGIILNGVNVTELSAKKDEYNGATFQGTYEPISMEGKYGVVPSDGRIALGTSTSSIDGFRAYFTLPAGSPAPTLSIDGGEATAIGTLRMNMGEDNVIFDLNGRRVETPNKGIYIINGKKVMVK